MPLDPVLQDAELDVHVERGVLLRLQAVLPNAERFTRLQRSIHPQIRRRVQQRTHLDRTGQRPQADVHPHRTGKFAALRHSPVQVAPLDQKA